MVRPLSVAVFRWLRRHQSTVVDGPGGEGYAYDDAYGDGGAGGGGAGGGGGYDARWAQRGPGGREGEYEATSSGAYGASSSSSAADADAESVAGSGFGSTFDVQEIPAYLPTAQEAELMEEERARKERANRGPGVYILYGYCTHTHTHAHAHAQSYCVAHYCVPLLDSKLKTPSARGCF